MSGFAYKKGFTLLELMVTLAVLAIVIGLAVPSFQQMIINNRLNTEVNTLVSALQLARSEAVKRGAEVRVAAVDGNWTNGFCVTLSSSDPCEDDDDDRIRVFEGAVSPLTSTPNNVTALVFNRMGELVGANAITLNMTLPSCPTGKVDGLRRLQIGMGGQVTLSRGNCS